MSLHKVDAIQESTSGSGVTITDPRFATLSALAAADAAVASNLVAGIAPAASATDVVSVRFDVLMGALARLGGVLVVTDPKFGSVADDGTTDCTSAIQAAVDAAPAGAIIWFPLLTGGGYKVTSTISVARRGIQFLFEGGLEFNGITYTGTGACIELGADDANNWDDANYDGAASHFAYIGGYLKYGGSFTALNNGLGSGYGSGTYAIRDWRGGSVRIENVKLSNWDYWFWGVQSDINRFRNLIISYNHNGCLLGARSDQFEADHVWSFNNDVVWQFEGVRGCTVRHWITDSDGSGTTNPAILRNSSPSVNARYATTRQWAAITFDQPWLESLAGGSTSFDVVAFFEVSTGESTRSGALVLRDPFVAVNFYSTASVQHTLYLVLADNCSSVSVEGLMGVPTNAPWTNLRAVFKVANAGASSNVPTLWFSERDQAGGRVVENYSATALDFHFLSSDASLSYQFNSVGGTGAIKRYGSGNFRRVLSGSVTWDPPSTATGAVSTATTVTVTNAAVGNGVTAAFSNALPSGCFLIAWVSASNTVSVQLVNMSGSTQDLASGTLRVYVMQDQFQ